MKVCEIFKSIQGEGKHAGAPVLFIRLSGCTRSCDFCDTKYHSKGKEMTTKQIVKEIENSGMDTIVWTGGEPMLQEDEIGEVIYEARHRYHCLETNGDLLPQSPSYFSYICFSPKEERVAKNVMAYCMQLGDETEWDIKIVTDLELNKDLIEYATMLMPLNNFDKNDQRLKQKVWNYCVKHNIKYCHRVHVDVWGQDKGK